MVSPPKRSKIAQDVILNVAKEASEIEMPWADVAPFFVERIEEFSCPHNVVKEMMFMAMHLSIAALLGSRSFVKPSLQDPYSKNFSLLPCASPLHHQVKVKCLSTERKSPFPTLRMSVKVPVFCWTSLWMLV